MGVTVGQSVPRQLERERGQPSSLPPRSSPTPTAPQWAAPRKAYVGAGATRFVPQGAPRVGLAAVGDQIRPDQEDQISYGSQPPLKPARWQRLFAKAHEQIVEDAAHAEGRIGGLERLETERVETQVLFQFLNPVLTVGSARVHSGVQFCSKGDTGDENAVRITRTLDQPPLTRTGAVHQRLAQTHKPVGLAVPGQQRGHHVGDRDAPCDGPPVGFRNPVNHHFAHQRGEPGHDDVRHVPGNQQSKGKFR